MAADNKKVDGIKKANKADLEESRNIVLKTIGEFDKPASPAQPEPEQRGRKVDSIQPIKEAPDLAKDYIDSKNKEKIEEKAISRLDKKKKKAWRDEIKKILPNKPKEQIKPEPTPDIREKPDQARPLPVEPKIEKKKNIEPKEPETEIVSRINPFKNDIVEKRIKDQEALSGKTAAEEARAKRQKHEELLKLKLNKEKIAKQKLKAKQAVRRIRLKKIKQFFTDLKLSIANIKNNLWRALKLSMVTIFAAVLIMILLYSVLAVSILKFNFINPVTTYISNYLPVPAFITRDGIVEYSVYDRIRAELEAAEGVNVNEGDIKVKIAEQIIYEALARKYGLAFSGTVDEQLRDDISARLVKDAEINQVGIYRIQKIKSLISQGENFVTVSNKYGDDQDLLTLTDANRGDYPFADQASNLGINQISDIIYSNDGYYIFRCYDKDKKQIALSYVFVNAKTLDQYLNDAVEGYKMWSLVE